eukprot:1929576-Pleurochrysis_carterae.AAC.1
MHTLSFLSAVLTLSVQAVRMQCMRCLCARRSLLVWRSHFPCARARGLVCAARTRTAHALSRARALTRTRAHAREHSHAHACTDSGEGVRMIVRELVPRHARACTSATNS